jgi:hypothetical protein
MSEDVLVMMFSDDVVRWKWTHLSRTWSAPVMLIPFTDVATKYMEILEFADISGVMG